MGIGEKGLNWGSGIGDKEDKGQRGKGGQGGQRGISDYIILPITPSPHLRSLTTKPIPGYGKSMF